jgi:hypothetical protein
VCTKCGKSADTEDMIEEAIKKYFDYDCHRAAMRGGNDILDECPECWRETYVCQEDKCLNPGCEFVLGDRECVICSEKLTLDDYRDGDGFLCSYHMNSSSKDD